VRGAEALFVTRTALLASAGKQIAELAIATDLTGDTLSEPETKFALDSLLEGDGFEPLVPGRETVKPLVGDGTACSKTGADLLGNRKFESISLQR
jgi:hypothetical protein